jgi:hypothetical protein
MFTSAAQYTRTKTDTHTRTQTQAYKCPTSRYLAGELREMKYVTFVIYYSYSYPWFGLFVSNRCRWRELSLHLITHTHTHTVGLLWTVERSVGRAFENTQHLDNVSSWIRTRNPSKQRAAFPRLRTRGHSN